MFRHTFHTRLLTRLLALIFVGLTLTASQGQAQPLPAAQSQRAPSFITVWFHQVQRPVAIYVPNSYRGDVEVPLVFALHGDGGDASKMFESNKHIVDYAESQGFIAVFPNGLLLPTDTDPDSHNFYWGDPVNIDYMNHLITLMRDRFTINWRRIYFIGFSGGGKLCYRLAARPDISARIAAIATVAGDIGTKQTDPPTSPWEIIDPSVSTGAAMSALLLQGGADVRTPAAGGFKDDYTSIKMSFQSKVDIWRFFVGAIEGVSETLPGAPADVEAMRYTNPTTGNVVISALDPGLPHKWPEWNFMGAIWDFFEHAPTR
jgi:poly(3-hydroxybutyrate) depolymerase